MISSNLLFIMMIITNIFPTYNIFTKNNLSLYAKALLKGS